LSPQNKDALLRKGQIQYNTIGKKYDGTDLFKARELYPKDPDVHIFIARYYAIIGEGEKGISEIERALKLDSTNSEAFYWMARISFEDLDRGDKSIEAISTAIRLSPMNTLYYSYRGNILRDKLKLFDQALTDFSKAIELDPTDVDYYYQRGVLYDDYLNQDEKALKDYQKTLEIDPAYVDAINAIGVIYEEQGKLDLAIAQYEKGMALEKSNPTAAAFCYSNRASLYANQKKLDEALKDYTKAIELDPKNPDLYHNRAIFFIDVMEDFNNALIDYSKAIELDPRDVDYYYKRGTLYYDYLNQDEKALMDCQKILEIDPAYVDAINVIGVIYEDQNKLDLAIEQYTKGVELEKVAPQSAALCYSNRARIYSLQGKYEEALSDFSKAIELDEKNPHKYFLRADFFIENLDDPNSALKDYSMAIELNPDELLFYYLRGVVYNEHLNQKDKAIKDFQKVLEIDPNDVDAINEIGLIFEEQGRIDLAIEQYSKGIILENSIPQSAAFCYSNRARIYQEQGNLTLALQDYTKAIALDQNNILHFYNRGDFYNYKMKRPYEALVDYSLALTLDSQNMYPWFQRGLLFSAELNDHRSAINDFQQILRIDSNDVTVLNWIGVFYARLQDEETEKDYYLRTIAKENYKFDDSLQMHVNGISYAYQNLAEMLQTTDEKTKAYEYYTKAILFDKTNPEKFYYRGWFLASYTDNYDDALEDLNKSVGLENDNPKWHLNRAKILYLKGDYKSAKKDFDQAVKLSEESAIYLAERGNFYSKIGDFKKAQFDFNNALMKDSTVRITYHFMTENYIRQKMENEAIHFTQSTAMRFDNDTVSYEQLGRLYLEKKELLKSLKAYQTAAAIMDYNLAYRTIEPGADQIYISDVYGQIATIYGLLNEKDLQCDALQNAKGNLGFETRPNKKEVEEILKEKISNVCN
jgi:tetratricopeptide (TPR) repeat protein